MSLLLYICYIIVLGAEQDGLANHNLAPAKQTKLSLNHLQPEVAHQNIRNLKYNVCLHLDELLLNLSTGKMDARCNN